VVRAFLPPFLSFCRLFWRLISSGYSFTRSSSSALTVPSALSLSLHPPGFFGRSLHELLGAASPPFAPPDAPFWNLPFLNFPLVTLFAFTHPLLLAAHTPTLFFLKAPPKIQTLFTSFRDASPNSPFEEKSPSGVPNPPQTVVIDPGCVRPSVPPSTKPFAGGITCLSRWVV